jgi:hypothetical protein
MTRTPGPRCGPRPADDLLPPLTQPGSAPHPHPVPDSAAPNRAPPQPCAKANDGDLHRRSRAAATARSTASQQRHRMGAALGGSAAACPRRRWGLARCDAPIPAADPVDDQAAIVLGCLLPREVTRVERMDLAVGEEAVEVLVGRTSSSSGTITMRGGDTRRN